MPLPTDFQFFENNDPFLGRRKVPAPYVAEETVVPPTPTITAAPPTPMEQEYANLLNQAPQYKSPSKLQMILAAIAGGTEGYLTASPSRGAQVSQNLLMAPYQQQLALHQQRLANIAPQIDLEQRQWERGKTQAGFGQSERKLDIAGYNATTNRIAKMIQDEFDRDKLAIEENYKNRMAAVAEQRNKQAINDAAYKAEQDRIENVRKAEELALKQRVENRLQQMGLSEIAAQDARTRFFTQRLPGQLELDKARTDLTKAQTENVRKKETGKPLLPGQSNQAEQNKLREYYYNEPAFQGLIEDANEGEGIPYWRPIDPSDVKPEQQTAYKLLMNRLYPGQVRSK